MVNRVFLSLSSLAVILAYTTDIALAQAAPATLEIVRSPVTGRAVFVTMKDGGALPVALSAVSVAPRPLDIVREYRDLFGLEDVESQLKSVESHRDLLGFTTDTFQQVHDEVPVFGGVLKTHRDAAGRFVAINGNVFPVPTKLSVIPAIDATQAGVIAVATAQFAGARVESSQLVIVDPGWYGDRPQGPHLAWYLRINDDSSGMAEGYFVDARSGRILDRWLLTDSVKDRKIHNASGGTAVPGPVARLELEPPTNILEVDRAYDHAGDTYDYWFRGFGRDSIDGFGRKLVLTVNSTAVQCPNAFWNGIQAVFCAGLTIDDIVGHELTHGLVDHTARLIYQNQPGQLNESYADVFGELIDLFNGDVAFPGPPMTPAWPVHPTGGGLDLPNNARTDECIGGFSVDIHQPVGLAGTYIAGGATYGPPLTEIGLTGRLVMVDPPLACPAGVTFTNAAQIAGNFAVVDRGDCNLVDKSANAQNAGAIGVVIVNNRPGRPPNPNGVNPSIVIPTVGVTQFDGQAFKAALAEGEIVELTMRANPSNQSVRWLLGEAPSAAAFRDMWRPICRAHPDRANHPFQTCDPLDNGGVHSGSGVPNHAFALVTDGGSFNGFDISGIGPIKSGAVWYRALTTYLTVTSDFESAYAALNQSAANLIGTFPIDPRTGFPSNDEFTAHDAEQVDLAMRAVEMNSPGLCGAVDAVLNPAPPALCPARLTFFRDDFSGSVSGWSVANTNPPTPYDWRLATGLPMGRPGIAWYASDPNLGDCEQIDESAVHSLFSPPITLFEIPASPMVSFTHFVAVEPGYDGGNVSLSVNGGPFSLIPPEAFTYNSYNSVIASDSTNPLVNQPAFTGLGAEWGTSVVDLSSFAGPGDSVQFRFDFGKDGCAGADGWYIADVNVFGCLPPGNGDFDGNGRVDLADMATFQSCMGRSARGTSPCAKGDLDGSTIVNLGDFRFFLGLLEGP